MKNMSKYKIYRSKFLAVMRIAYPIFVILYLVTYFQFANWSEFAVYDMHNHNIVPLKTISEGFAQYGIFYIDVLVGVLMFIPIGLLSATAKSRPSVIAALGLSMLCSFGIELLQYLLGTGTLNVDDLLLNFIGGLIGSIIYHIIKSFQSGKTDVKVKADANAAQPQAAGAQPQAAGAQPQAAEAQPQAAQAQPQAAASAQTVVRVKDKTKWFEANNIVSIIVTVILPFILFFVLNFALTTGAYTFAFWHPILFLAYFAAIFFGLIKDFKVPQLVSYFAVVLVLGVLFFTVIL